MQTVWLSLFFTLALGCGGARSSSATSSLQAMAQIEFDGPIAAAYFNSNTNTVTIFAAFPQSGSEYAFSTPSCSGLEPIVCQAQLLYTPAEAESPANGSVPSTQLDLLTNGQVDIHLEPQYDQYEFTFAKTTILIETHPKAFTLKTAFAVSLNLGLTGFKKYTCDGENVTLQQAMQMGETTSQSAVLTTSVKQALSKLTFASDSCTIPVNPFLTDSTSSLTISGGISCNNPAIATKITEALQPLGL